MEPHFPPRLSIQSLRTGLVDRQAELQKAFDLNKALWGAAPQDPALSAKTNYFGGALDEVGFWLRQLAPVEDLFDEVFWNSGQVVPEAPEGGAATPSQSRSSPLVPSTPATFPGLKPE